MDVKSTWIPTSHRMDHVSWSSLSKTTSRRDVHRPNTKPGDRGAPISHNRRFGIFHRVRGSHVFKKFVEIGNSTLHGFEKCLGTVVERPFWALTISWSRVLAHV